MPQEASGLLAGRAGPLLASADRFFIELKGRGGHASMPHQGRDPIPVACELVMAMQSFVTRRIDVHDPAVVTVGTIEAGTTDNVIPESARLSGTIRTLSSKTRAFLQLGLERLAIGIAEAHEIECEIRFVPGFPVTLCDARAVELGQQVAVELGGETGWRTLPAAIMGAEDFSYVLEKVPGAMFFLGAGATGDEGAQGCCPGLHSAQMVIDEQAMVTGAAYLAALARRFLDRGFD